MASFPARIGNWVLGENIGSGFSGKLDCLIWYYQVSTRDHIAGSIFHAFNPYTHQNAAIKIQHVNTDCPTNRYERNFYPSLQGGKGMPTLWASGVDGVYDYLVMDLLGFSLDSLYRQNGKQVMDLRSVICIAMQVVSSPLQSNYIGIT